VVGKEVEGGAVELVEEGGTREVRVEMG
jgi:hypothetical protein